jgi:hypothetical protein
MRNDRLRLEDVLDSIEQIENTPYEVAKLSMTTNLSGFGSFTTLESSARLVAASLMPSAFVTRMRFGLTPSVSETFSFTNTLALTTRRFERWSSGTYPF